MRSSFLPTCQPKLTYKDFCPGSLLKVSKFRKQIDLFSFEPKTEQNISALRIDP